MEDSKLNNRIHGAVRKGARGAAAGARSLLGRMKLWQKAGLILCLVSWIISAVIGAVCSRITGGLVDQNYAPRWAPDRESAQVSVFMSGAAGMSDETVPRLYSDFMRSLQTDSLTLSETQVENGASALDVSYCGIGNAEISTPDESVSVTMIGVGGSFFNFHPLTLLDGYYFSDDELMKDRILLDDATAWRLFGSPNVVGMSVNIGGTPHYIAGVFERPEGRFYEYAGMGEYMVFISYDSLCRYTEAGASSGDDSGSMESDLMDARAPAGNAAAAARLCLIGEDMGEDSRPDSGPDGRDAEELLARAASAESGVPLTAAWQPSSPGKAVQQAGGQTFSLQPDHSLISLEGDEMPESSEEEPEEEVTEKAEEDEETDEEGADDPVPGDMMNGGAAPRGEDALPEAPEKEEINRNRINCYEVVLPDPISGYAIMLVRGCLQEAGISTDQIVVVQNSSRYDTFRLASLVMQPGVRSMQTAAIRYPYWENVALAWEDVLIPFALLQLFLRYAPVLFLLYLLLWYATHKTWTVGGLVLTAQDRIYEWQSERIYARPPKHVLEEDEETEKRLTGETEPQMDGLSDPSPHTHIGGDDEE